MKKISRLRPDVVLRKNVQKFFKSIFISNANHVLWIVGTLVLLVTFVFLAAYNFRPDFNHSVNVLFWGTQQTANNQGTQQTKKTLFHLGVTVVYDSSSKDQKAKMDVFLGEMVDVHNGLVSTDLQTTWLDSKDPKAQALIAQSGLKYLPQMFIDSSIEQHPQFKAMQQYLTKKGNIYFIRVAPLESLETPATTGGQVAGIDPSQAKVVIQYYESYSCVSEDCLNTEATLKKILQDYPATVSVVYKHFEPGETFNLLAQGAECAADQHQFLAMQDKILKAQPQLEEELQSQTADGTSVNGTKAAAYATKTLEGFAKQLRLNTKVFQTCLDNKTHYVSIDQGTLDAIDYGIGQPPTFFINDKFQNGLLSYDEFKTIIDGELKK